MIALILLHYVADFLLQSRTMGQKKSEEFKWLSYHLLIQFFVFLPVVSWKFSLVNTLIHGLIDWNIWKAYKWSAHYRIMKQVTIPKDQFGSGNQYYQAAKNFKYWEDHLFYSTIGLDQSLHMMTLYCLWWIKL